MAFRQIAARLAAGMGLLNEPEDPKVGGLTVPAWFEVFWGTREPSGFGGLHRIEWPEPGGFGDQPVLLIDALAAIEVEVLKEAERERRRSGN